MSQVHIVTDSSIRFTTPDFLEKGSVTLAPMKVRCGPQSVEDWPNSDLVALRHLIERCVTLPKIETSTVAQFAAIYTQLQNVTDKIISIHTSSGICDAVDHANQAKQQFLGKTDIQVIDSQTTSIGLGLLVQAAAEAISQGANLETLVRLTRGMKSRLYMIFFLNDLTYLEQQGLVSRSQAILGNMLGIVPFLTMEEGQLIPMEKVRSRTRAIEKLIEFVFEFSDIEHLAILQDSSQPNQETFSVIERLHAFRPHTPITTSCYGPCMSTHVGLESLGIVVLEAEEESK